jgi:hypothetical protein
MTMQRVTVGADAYTYSDPFVGPDGETPLSSPSVPVVTVTDATGVVLAAPIAVDDGSGTGRYRVTLTAAAHLLRPDLLTVTWTLAGQTQRHLVDVAGGRYATIADLRAVPVLANPGEFPASRLADAITEFEDLADRYRGVAYVPRVRVAPFRLEWCREAVLFNRAEVRDIRKVADADGVDLDVAGWYWGGADLMIDPHAAGLAYTVHGSGYAITVAFEHGYDLGVPDGLRRACIEFVRATVLKEQSGNPRDVIATAADGFVTRYSTPDWSAGRPTGYLEVDRRLNELPDRRLPGIA